MSNVVIAQCIGAVAVIISLAVFQVNKRSLMLWLSLSAGILFGVHFVLLGALTGAALNFIGVARSYCFVKVTPARKNVWILLIFISIAAIATVATWKGLVSLLAFTGNTASGIAFWQRKPKDIRRWAFIPPPLWFSYNALSGSYPGMFIELFNFVSLLIGTYRFDWRMKKRRLIDNRGTKS